MKFLVTQRPKQKYSHLRAVAVVVEADSLAAAKREALRISSDFAAEYTHKATQVEPFNVGEVFYI